MNSHGFCQRCGDPTNIAVQGLDERWLSVCVHCSSILNGLLDQLPFTAKECKPGNDNDTICRVVINAFFNCYDY